MTVLYLTTSPEPAFPGTDAVYQEIDHLRKTIGGELINLFPLRKPTSRFPAALYGLHEIVRLYRLEQKCSICHVYFPTLYYFPVLSLLRRPIVYTVVAGLDRAKDLKKLDPLASLHRIVVSNQRDANALASLGLSNCSVIRPGHNVSGIKSSYLAPDKEFILLMASAPWEYAQFDTKGIDALLKAASKLRFLRLIFIWRGLLFNELKRKVQQYSVVDQVECVNQRIDINDYFQRCHATVLLATKADIVKAFPHSLIESLAARKPVLLSDAIPMADFVSARGCGVVLKDLNLDMLVDSITQLFSHYETFRAPTEEVDEKTFSLESMVEGYRSIYGI